MFRLGLWLGATSSIAPQFRIITNVVFKIVVFFTFERDFLLIFFVDSCRGGGVDLFVNALYGCAFCLSYSRFAILLFYALMRVREEERIKYAKEKSDRCACSCCHFA